MFKKILKILLVIIIIIIISLIINNLREANMIYKYSQKLDEYNNIKNFYAKYQDDGHITECWTKDDRGVRKETLSDDEKRLMYVDNECIWMLTESKDENGELKKEAVKQKHTSEKGVWVPKLSSYSVYAENRVQALAFAINTTILEEEIDGEHCYKIKLSDDLIIFINKETYMLKKEINCGREITLLEYKLNYLSDDDLELLNFLGYNVRNVD